MLLLRMRSLGARIVYRLVRLVHRCCIDDVLQVPGNAGSAVVTQLLDYLEAVQKGAVIPHARLPLGYTDCVVYFKSI